LWCVSIARSTSSHSTSFLIVVPRYHPINHWWSNSNHDVSPVHHPESPELSYSLSEAAPKLLASTLATPVAGGHETKPRRLEQAVESNRRSDEHLETESSVSKEPAMPALTETRRRSRESFACGWKVIQEGAVCFAVLQESSTVDEITGITAQRLGELNIVSNEAMSVHLHSPASLVTPLSPILSRLPVLRRLLLLVSQVLHLVNCC